MRNLLFFEIGNPAETQIFLSGEKNQKKISFRGRGNFLFFLDKFLRQNKLSWSKIRGLILLEGGGSFSGVRQAAAVLNIISLIKGIPVSGVDARCFKNKEEIFAKFQRTPPKGNSFIKPIYSGEPNITHV